MICVLFQVPIGTLKIVVRYLRNRRITFVGDLNKMFLKSGIETLPYKVLQNIVHIYF